MAAQLPDINRPSTRNTDLRFAFRGKHHSPSGRGDREAHMVRVAVARGCRMPPVPADEEQSGGGPRRAYPIVPHVPLCPAPAPHLLNFPLFSPPSLASAISPTPYARAQPHSGHPSAVRDRRASRASAGFSPFSFRPLFRRRKSLLRLTFPPASLTRSPLQRPVCGPE